MLHIHQLYSTRWRAVACWAVAAFSIVSTGVDARRQDVQNTSEFTRSPIDRSNVDQLELKWKYTTVEDDGSSVNLLTGAMPKANTGAVNSTPTADGPYLYFNDSAGLLHKVNRRTGEAIPGWPKSYLDDFSVDGFSIAGSRTSPLIAGDLIIVGSNVQLFATLCDLLPPEDDPNYPFDGPRPLVCTEGDGAIVIAIDKHDGSVRWRTKVDRHPSTKITGSISRAGRRLIVPVGHWEEDWARGYPAIEPDFANEDEGTDYVATGPAYECCSARGSVVALDLHSGEMLWKTYTSPGNGDLVRLQRNKHTGELDAFSVSDETGLPQHVVNEAMQAPEGTRGPDGFWGTSVYGHNPTIDRERRLVYVGMSQNELAPAIAEFCEQARREAAAQGVPTPIAAKAEVEGLPGDLTCANLNQKLHNFGNAVVAMDLRTGKVKWSHYARLYDAWHHGCGAPDFYGDSLVNPLVFPIPIENAANCEQNPVGPDLGFGQHPILIKDALPRSKHNQDKRRGDVLVIGNKDGRVFGLDPETGAEVWEKDVDPGGILGGSQWGIASDGKRVYLTTRNSQNFGRDINDPFVPAFDEDPSDGTFSFLQENGFDQVGIRTGPFIKEDGALPRYYPGPGILRLPFPGPARVFGVPGFPETFPPLGATAPEEVHPLCNPLFGFDFDGCIKGPQSGPADLWELVNPPSDTVVDGFNVIRSGSKLFTTAGMVQALDPKNGDILWQRPAVDGRGENDEIFGATVDGRLTVGNGVVLVGYKDTRGTFVALNARNGKLLWKFQDIAPNGETYGLFEGSPLVVGRWVYIGAGSDTSIYFPDKTNVWRGNSYGNRVYGFKLPRQADDDDH